MRELGLEPCQPKPRRFNLTQGAPRSVPDFAGRNFTADAPGEKLVGDITYIATAEGWLYLAAVLDCNAFTRRWFTALRAKYTPLTAAGARRHGRAGGGLGLPATDEHEEVIDAQDHGVVGFGSSR
ncbi:hypothetical protein [Streptomyces ferrugineus]|nr:hypothetical protein [Streptomyces ferrugineus]